MFLPFVPLQLYCFHVFIKLCCSVVIFLQIFKSNFKLFFLLGESFKLWGNCTVTMNVEEIYSKIMSRENGAKSRVDFSVVKKKKKSFISVFKM